ncbi:flagellar L-ring protein FlgH [Novosphingobium sp. Rr 2-17]|uniref:flagellar basal body L-ring protein FlgH n=1 Tax=Novosphingobium sp. Rr 2-17 TaxID=555793 RepID=UPI0002699542|nr:flagellar basal body L-ring protein FlgH [Novosphingobium sp. Rr 2-17]EIZ78733.1 flagellar L-ring protein FlgH [Novosphingobium sp. Rr 2-17]
MKIIVPFALVALSLSGCGSVGHLKAIGKPPKLSPAEQSASPAVEASLGQQSAASRSGTLATGMATPPPSTPSASLFRTGSGAFFRDQRAGRVGDILTVKINIADKAAVDNTTTRSRTGTEKSGLTALLGLQTPLAKALPGAVDPSKLIDTNSSSESNGAGNTSRSETINMTIAATVIGVMPNGNLLIRGKQEVRVNFELRELVVSGMVRPEDIARDNSIQHSQIAEARISYGGRGQLTDAQQARWGQQIYDALFPF